ncbi:MAG: hypothetical protein KC593_06390, partial [Myxococcales bacterium]|nr:hypothetical protein [Myxococcales bacterium]
VRSGVGTRSWVARCAGEAFQCSRVGEGCTRCAPARGGRGAAGDTSEMSQADAASAEDSLRRDGPRFEFSRDGDTLRGVRATFRTEGASVVFTFAPERGRDTVHVSVTARDGETLAACEELVLTDERGTLLSAPLTDHAATLPRRQLIQHTRAQPAPSVRFCGQVWALRRADVRGFARFAEHMNEALANAPAEAAPAEEPPVSGADQAVRAQLDQRAASLRACAGVSAAEVLPIEATWDVAGSVVLRLRGRDDQALHDCATSVLGPWRAPAGAAGRLIHVLTPQ